MLTVKILNLRQDENNHADYVVHINTTLERLDYFLIKGFDRARGWRELLTEVVKKVERGATGAGRRGTEMSKTTTCICGAEILNGGLDIVRIPNSACRVHGHAAL